MKTISRVLLSLFIVVVVFLTLFSKTLYNSRLPKVSVSYPEKGRIEKSFQADGYVKTKTYFVYPPVQGEVFEILVNEGAYVEQGELLAIIKNDTGEMEGEHSMEEEHSMEIKSSHTGIVETVNAKIGQQVNPTDDTELMRISMLQETYEAVFTITENPGYITFGMETTFIVNGSSFTGTVINMKDISESGGIELTVIFDVTTGIPLKNNANIQMIIDFKSEPGQTLIRNLCIDENYGNPFVYVLEKKNGAFGEEYFVEKYPIDVIDMDGTYSSVSNTDIENRSVVTGSSRGLSDKMKVRLDDGD
ncbi:MAG: Biotin-requiring enzyme [Herbinix sp.]|nr:Biotin-requiring enzyme [Herbinix sp.]